MSMTSDVVVIGSMSARRLWVIVAVFATITGLASWEGFLRALVDPWATSKDVPFHLYVALIVAGLSGVFSFGWTLWRRHRGEAGVLRIRAGMLEYRSWEDHVVRLENVQAIHVKSDAFGRPVAFIVERVTGIPVHIALGPFRTSALDMIARLRAAGLQVNDPAHISDADAPPQDG